MNTQKYIEQLEQQNKYCECPDLKELFEKRKTARGLETKCDFLKGNVDLDKPMPQDESILQDYKGESEQLRRASESYHNALYQNALDAQVYFEMHEPETIHNPRKIQFEEVEPLFRDNKGKIVSIHCSFCDTQFDVLAVNK